MTYIKDCIEEFNPLFLKSIEDDNITRFYNFLPMYNYKKFYKISNSLYIFKISGIVLELGAYNIILFLLDEKEISFNEISKYFNGLEIYPLYQIFTSNCENIKKHSIKLCKRILERDVSMYNTIYFIYDKKVIRKNSIQVCKENNLNFLNILLKYEKYLDI